MATLQSVGVTAGRQPRTNIGTNSVTDYYTLTAALEADDVIEMITVPKGAVVQEIIVSCADLDTGATPTIVLDVGDDGDVDRFIDGATIGQAGGLTKLGTNGGHGYQYSAQNTIDVLVETGPATGATSGTIKMTAIYTMNDDV